MQMQRLVEGVRWKTVVGKCLAKLLSDRPYTSQPGLAASLLTASLSPH